MVTPFHELACIWAGRRVGGSIRGIKGLPPAFKDLRIDREIKFRWRDFNGEFCVKNCSLRQRRVRYFEGEIRYGN